MAIWSSTHACTLLYSTTNISEPFCIAWEPTLVAKFVVATISGLAMCFLSSFMVIRFIGSQCFFCTILFTPGFWKLHFSNIYLCSCTNHPGATVEAFASGGRPRRCRGSLIFVGGEGNYRFWIVLGHIYSIYLGIFWILCLF